MSHNRDGLATRMIKAEMARRGTTYDGLVVALGKLGVSETNQGLRNKFSRGTVSADLMLSCFAALEVKVIHLD